VLRPARTRPHGRLFLFGATASAIDTTAHTITVDVNFGNWRGLFALLGQPVHQTFHSGRRASVLLVNRPKVTF
jgi:hypothetical protein